MAKGFGVVGILSLFLSCPFYLYLYSQNVEGRQEIERKVCFPSKKKRREREKVILLHLRLSNLHKHWGNSASIFVEKIAYALHTVRYIDKNLSIVKCVFWVFKQDM